MRAQPLGSLLTGRGHITEEQLELALTEQKSTGRPLGEIIVARGFAPGPTIAQALATQHGGLLKTEYGFATGWGGQENSVARVPAEEAVPAADDPKVAALRASLEEHQKALEAWKQAHGKLQEELTEARRSTPAAAVADDSHVAELEALKGERDSLRAELAEAHRAAPVVDETKVAELEAELGSLRKQLAEPVEDPRVSELEAELASVREQLAEPVEQVEDPRLAELAGECESLRDQLALRAESIEQLEAKLSTVETACVDLEQSLAREVERGDAARAELATQQETPAGRWDAATSHLVFFQGSDGYEMHERKGPPPAAGSKVGRQIVARIASAPFPGNALPCAYLTD
jgi:hypothetical protein